MGLNPEEKQVVVLRDFPVSLSFMQFSYKARTTTKDAVTPFCTPSQTELSSGDGTVPGLSKFEHDLMKL